MSPPKKRVNSTKSHLKPLENGPREEKSNLSSQKEVTEDIILQTRRKQEQDPLSIPESRQESKKPISNDSQIILDTNIQLTKLSKTLEAELTTRGRDSAGYWTPYSNEISKRLWSSHTIDSSVSEQTTSYGCLNSSTQSSSLCNIANIELHQKNSQTTLWKLSPSSPPDTTDDEIVRTRKIKIYPTTEQREYFKKCMDAHRFLYNETISIADFDSKVPRRNIMRTRIFGKFTNDPQFKWLENVFFDTRGAAVEAARIALKTQYDNMRPGETREFKFMTKKDGRGVFHIDPKAFKNGYEIFVSKFKSPRLRFSSKDKKWIKRNCPVVKHESKIIRETNGRWYLCLSYSKPKKITSTKEEIVTLDPGIRTFQTFYSENTCGKISSDVLEKVLPLVKRLSFLENCIVNTTRQLQHFRHRCKILRTKISNIIRYYHNVVAKWLTCNYKTILIPKFATTDIAKKSNNKRLNSDMYRLAHYSFRQILKNKGHVMGSKVIECSEAHTTMTCGYCGTLNRSIGASKVHYCTVCEITSDRDMNAARNIMIRSLTKHYQA